MGDAGASRPRPSPEDRMVLWTPIRGDCSWLEARRTEGAPGLRGSRRGVFDPFHWARRDAKHARLPLSVTATAVTPSPPGKDTGLSALGRGSPTVAPLRVRLAPSALVERGGVLLRRPTEATHAPPAMHRFGEPQHICSDTQETLGLPRPRHRQHTPKTTSGQLPCRAGRLSCQTVKKVKHSVTVIRRRQTANRKSASPIGAVNGAMPLRGDFRAFPQEKLPYVRERPGA